jgi:hypothetical protein
LAAAIALLALAPVRGRQIYFFSSPAAAAARAPAPAASAMAQHPAKMGPDRAASAELGEPAVGVEQPNQAAVAEAAVWRAMARGVRVQGAA